ncbi:MAG: ATP-dependent HslUV protease ATP-binding subunit HslU, partial [Sphingomonadales bacterium]|nr:ATP-dependent HslUV protease ATP-binding subunit HslU [Sphingomonadales bacterium]
RPSPRRSPGSSRTISASSLRFAAPLEVAAGGPDIAAKMNYQTTISRSDGEQAEVLKDKLTPKAIVAALNEHIVGQNDAKKAVAVALRNRWRRQQLSPELRDEVTPKNILMIGPTGCGKTEISRRLAKLADAPFVKVEATKFTEVGYVGRDVEQIARDLVEEAVRLERDRRRAKVRAGAEQAAMDKLLDALTGKSSSEATRQSFKQRFADGSLDQAEVEIEVDEAPNMPFEIPGMGAQVFDLKSIMGKAMGGAPKKRRKLKVPEAFARLTDEEADKRLDPDDINRSALADAEANGIVFLDEIDKIAVSDVRGGSVSREGVQRDLLPLIEGTTVATKYGPLKTDHILFIASGAFHMAKPADLLPELQGRLPIRVELKALTQEDFVRILSATRASLTEQYQALLGTEGVSISFTDDGIEALARIAAEVNEAVENIGARRLQTVMEKLLEDVSFEAEDRRGESLVVDAAFVEQQLSSIAKNADLSRYVL